MKENKGMDMHLAEGPFKHLYIRWQFEPEDGGCGVSRDVDYEFSGKMVAIIAGGLLDAVCACQCGRNGTRKPPRHTTRGGRAAPSALVSA